MLDWFERHIDRPAEEIHVVMEATGIYHEALAYWLVEHGIKVSVVNPARVREFAKSQSAVHKTDKKDAAILAHFGQQSRLKLWVP